MASRHLLFLSSLCKSVFDDLKKVEEKGGYEKLKKEELLSLLRKIYDLPSTAIREQVVQSCDLHPTMKPVKLMGRLILYSSREGEIVLDPFGETFARQNHCNPLCISGLIRIFEV